MHTSHEELDHACAFVNTIDVCVCVTYPDWLRLLSPTLYMHRRVAWSPKLACCVSQCTGVVGSFFKGS